MDFVVKTSGPIGGIVGALGVGGVGGSGAASGAAVGERAESGALKNARWGRVERAPETGLGGRSVGQDLSERTAHGRAKDEAGGLVVALAGEPQRGHREPSPLGLRRLFLGFRGPVVDEVAERVLVLVLVLVRFLALEVEERVEERVGRDEAERRLGCRGRRSFLFRGHESGSVVGR